ncbi:MAG: DUF2461 domain-containing protein [Nocardioidaceae bacterium]|nr:DUF2461 domain-containing protein [Nocardioidaceae bacterium]
MSRAPAERFTGFPVEGLDFYDDLEADNTKTFWTAHRQVYLDAVRAPMTALLAQLEPEFGPGKVFRPYRDLRYSKDPTPYKAHQGGFVARSQSSGWYVELNAAGLRVSAGFYDASGSTLARYRQAVDEARTGTELQRLVGELATAGFVIGGDRLKTRPRGYDAGHPRLDLLRHRSLFASRDYYDSPGWLHRPQAAERVRDEWRRLRGLVEWIGTHVVASAAT